MASVISSEKRLLNAENVKRLFDYNSKTGVLTRIKGFGREELGPIKGKKLVVFFEGYVTTRVIWLWCYGKWPEGLVDHWDGNQLNNKLDNLRDATHTQNQYNKAQHNPHGFKGVTWRNRQKKPWLSKIRVDGTRINLGSFATKEEAAEAYKQACLKYHGEFACLDISR